jgi:putative transposase
VGSLTDEFEIQTLCRVSGLSPSSFYYSPRLRDETDLRDAIERIARKSPRYGSRRVTQMLRREGRSINRKRVQRLMREACLLVQIKRMVRTSIYRKGLGNWPNLLKQTVVSRANQVWVADITYVHVREQFVFVAVLMDLHTRAIRGWHLGETLEAILVREALEMALVQHSAPELHHSDHGVQYVSGEYVTRLQSLGVQLSLSSIGRPTENGYCERLMRTLKEEECSLQDYRSIEEARSSIGRFLMEVYNEHRIHSALGYRTPAEFEAEEQTKHSKPTRESGSRGGRRPKSQRPPKTNEDRVD